MNSLVNLWQDIESRFHNLISGNHKFDVACRTLNQHLIFISGHQITHYGTSYPKLNNQRTWDDLVTYLPQSIATALENQQEKQHIDHNQDQVWQWSIKHNNNYQIIIIEDISQLHHTEQRHKNHLKKQAEATSALKTIFDTTPWPIWTEDKTGRITWCNKSYADLYDCSVEDTITKQYHLKLSSKQNIKDQIKAYLPKSSHNDEIGHVIVKGDRRLLKVNKKDLNGTTFQFTEDITHLELMSKNLNRVRQTQTEILENLNTAIAVFDSDQHLVFYNPAFVKIWELDEKYLIKKPQMSDFLNTLRAEQKLPEHADFQHFKESWLNFFRALDQYHEEMMYLPDERTLRVMISHHHDGGIILTLEDITNALELETKYNTLIAVQQETLNKLTEGIAVYGSDGKLRLFNPAFAVLWDIPMPFLEKEPHITQIVENCRNQFDPADWDTMRTSLIQGGIERKSQSLRAFLNNDRILDIYVIPLPDGSLLNIHTDVSATVQIEDALEERNQTIVAIDRVKIDFLTNISHQIRTPLNTIIGFAEILNKEFFGDLNEKQKDYANGILKSGQRLVGLVNDMIDLASIEAGQLQLHPNPVKSKDLVQNLKDIAQLWAESKNIKLRFTTDKAEFDLQVDERRIKQIVICLIDTALQVSTPQAAIKIDLKLKQDSLTFSLIDLVLDPNQDMEFTTIDETENQTPLPDNTTGLRLVLVKRLVDLHQGDIKIETSGKNKTKLTCVLPLSNQNQENQERIKHAAS